MNDQGQPQHVWTVVLRRRPARVTVPEGLSAVASGPVVDHVFLLRLASALAAQDPPVTLVIDDLHLLTDPQVLKELDFVRRNAGPGLHPGHEVEHQAL